MSDLSQALSKYFNTFTSLRDELSKSLEGWDTPVIVVFGPQNSGKSTLLERLSMIPMFPKGDGLCTRVPIRIRLRTEEARAPVISLFDKGTQEKELDRQTLKGELLPAVTTLMEQLIEQEATSGRGVRRDRLIQVELWGPSYPNIDLLDLPGMVVSAREGDNPKLPEETYQLVLDTVDELEGRAIFLAVREAGQDLNQSLTNKILRERPKLKEVSLGVLTKCDNSADKQILKELDASDEWQLGYGYVATMNDPDGVESATNLEALSQAEREWFSGKLKTLGEERVGCDVLVQKLAKAYHAYLEGTWAPKTLAYLRQRAEERQEELKALGLPAGGEATSELLSAVREALSVVAKRGREVSLQAALSRLQEAPLWEGHELPQGFDVEEREGSLVFSSAEFLSQAFDSEAGLQAQLTRGVSALLSELLALPKRDIEPLLRGDHKDKQPLTSARLARFPDLIDYVLKTINTPQREAELRAQLKGLLSDHIQSAPLIYNAQEVILRDLAGLRGRLITPILQTLSDSRLHLSDEVKLHLKRDLSALERAELRGSLEALKHSQGHLIELFGEEVAERSKDPTLLVSRPQVGERIESKVGDVVFYERVIPGVDGGEPFLMMETQVTQELWEAVMASNPSKFKGARRPVETVSWEDCVKFANALSRKLGLTPAFKGSSNNSARFVEGVNGFRLPFDVEWAWAAKGGQSFTYAGSNNLSEVGWFRDNSNQQTHDVAKLKPNGYGVYDMSGNVWEWCLDDPSNLGLYRPGAALRVCRGGSWNDGARNCSVARRDCISPDGRFNNLGLRLSRSLGF